jgi:hypothetical protein
MKHTTLLFALILAGCQTIPMPDIKPPVINIPPITIPTGGQPDKPATPLPAGCKCDLTAPLCDPNPSKYTQAYMDKNGSWEECGIEAGKKVVCRYCVIRGDSGGFWMMSSIGMDYVSRANPCKAVCILNLDGYNYHVKGYLESEPQGNAIKTATVKDAGKYVVVECRKIK